MSQVEVNASQYTSTRFGTIDLREDQILHFVRPILGFEKYSQFCLLPHGEGSPFTWLQSLQEADLAFVLTIPSLFGISYIVDVPDEILIDLRLPLATVTAADILIYTMTTIPPDYPERMTANLLAPVIIAPSTGLAVQTILTDGQYTTKVSLIPEELVSC